MINILEMVLMGVLATFIMDILAVAFSKLKIIKPLIGPEVVGRWFLYMFRGKFVHNDINRTPALNNEKLWALIAHYLIGIALAGIYLFSEVIVPEIRDQLYMPLLFGLATTVLPWFWLYPSIGIGFIASKTSNRSAYIKTSLINHTDFGLGLTLWVVVFRRFFV